MVKRARYVIGLGLAALICLFMLAGCVEQTQDDQSAAQDNQPIQIEDENFAITPINLASEINKNLPNSVQPIALVQGTTVIQGSEYPSEGGDYGFVQKGTFSIVMLATGQNFSSTGRINFVATSFDVIADYYSATLKAIDPQMTDDLAKQMEDTMHVDGSGSSKPVTVHDITYYCDFVQGGIRLSIFPQVVNGVSTLA